MYVPLTIISHTCFVLNKPTSGRIEHMFIVFCVEFALRKKHLGRNM